MTDGSGGEPLADLFGQPGLKRLIDRLATRYERGVDSPVVVLADASEDERRAIAGLLGKPVGSGRSLRIRLDDLDEALTRAGLASGVRDAISRVRGPLRDLPAERASQQRQWEAVFDSVAAAAGRQAPDDWLDELRSTGLLKRLANGNPRRAATLMRESLEVLGRLPGRGQSLSTLAANALGDAHALDSGRPVATLVMRVIRKSPDEIREDATGESVREIWARAGVLVGGAITSTVLVLNLPAIGDSGCDEILRQAGRAGQPLWLTLRQLVTDLPTLSVSGGDVFVCENPAVVAEAADRLGSGSAPLVCSYGQPGAALGHLLDRLVGAGARLRYHGDFDWPGIAIANGLVNRFGVVPWRFDNAAYLAAAGAAPMSLEGRPVEAVWDTALSKSMQRLGIAVPEERVIETVIADLRGGLEGRSGG